MGKTLALVLAGLWLFNLARLIATGLPGDAPEDAGVVAPAPVPIVAEAEPAAIEPAAPATPVAPADSASTGAAEAGADSSARPDPLALDAAGVATSDPE